MRPSFRQPDVGRRLRALRERRGLTRAELSEAAKVDPSTLARLEGGADVRLSSYFAIVSYFLKHEPHPWMLVERVIALEPQEREKLKLRVLGLDGGEHD